MFNTMTTTKTAAALIGSLLTMLLLFWAGSALFHVGPAEGSHDGEAIAQAYSIPVESSGGGEAEAEEEQIDFAALMEAADPASGEKVFGKCRACHKVDGSDGTGPHLNGVVGRAVAGADGFSYSDAMVAHAGEAPEWTPEALQEFLADPKGVVPQTKMVFAGLPKPQDRADLVAYLQSTQ